MWLIKILETHEPLPFLSSWIKYVKITSIHYTLVKYLNYIKEDSDFLLNMMSRFIGVSFSYALRLGPEEINGILLIGVICVWNTLHLWTCWNLLTVFFSFIHLHMYIWCAVNIYFLKWNVCKHYPLIYI